MNEHVPKPEHESTGADGADSATGSAPASTQSSAPGGAGGGGPSAGVQIMHGHLRKEAKGFWEDAWSQVIARPGAVIGMIWIGIVAFFAVFAPVVANGHPLVLEHLNADGQVESWSSPLLRNLTSVDVMLLIGGVFGPLLVLLPGRSALIDRIVKSVVFGLAGGVGISAMTVGLPTPVGDAAFTTWLLALAVGTAVTGTAIGLLLPGEAKRSERLMTLLIIALHAGVIVFLAERIAVYADQRAVSDFVRSMERRDDFAMWGSIAAAVVGTLPLLFVPFLGRLYQRIIPLAAVAVLAATVTTHWWMPPMASFDYTEREQIGEVAATYTVIPYSPNQRHMELDVLPPLATALDSDKYIPPEGASRDDYTPFVLGTDSSGQDLLSQLIHACRLSISIGFVATGIATLIGVTMGSLMGYFGGWVDMLLYRVVEVFMAIPLLFLLIVAAAVLPRNIYVMMVLIGCVTWTNSARFIRAEFYRLRDQDFVQAARALGLPLRHVMFRHMLPNGVTPVLVEVSFAVAVVILFESILSFLGLGPADQASWGKLLSEAFDSVGDFMWWLAMAPGFAIFLTVLSLTLVGEAMRDAIDPKLKKAAND